MSMDGKAFSHKCYFVPKYTSLAQTFNNNKNKNNNNTNYRVVSLRATWVTFNAPDWGNNNNNNNTNTNNNNTKTLFKLEVYLALRYTNWGHSNLKFQQIQVFEERL